VVRKRGRYQEGLDGV